MFVLKTNASGQEEHEIFVTEFIFWADKTYVEIIILPSYTHKQRRWIQIINWSRYIYNASKTKQILQKHFKS